MGELSHYESRLGKVTGTPEDVFGFVTDLRNFERFIPEGTINNWQTTPDSCSFSVAMVGTVALRISGKEPCSQVVYEGDALKKNDFTLALLIGGDKGGSAEVQVNLDADLNPMLRMVANKPIITFLELLIKEMENFRGWSEIIK